jgi:LPS O-antigen subunit length determinant protein (WzzB/FepE family)
MQNTRLNTLTTRTAAQLTQLFSNPWRRASLLLISVLLGFFLGSAISTISGQATYWDVVVAAIVVAGIELINRLAYGAPEAVRRSLPTEVLNAVKIGIVYSLCLEAFKLGS